MKTVSLLLLIAVSILPAQYALTVERTGGAARAGEHNLFRAQVTKNGTAIHTIERQIPFDVPFPATYLNERTGVVVVTHSFDGFAEVYDATGKKTWEWNFFKEMSPNYERTITVALGTHIVAFLTSDVRRTNALVHRFDIRGTLLWETALPHAMGYEIAMSDDEQIIAAGSYFVLEDEVRQSAAVLNGEGTIVGDAGILFRSAAFNTDYTQIGFVSEREAVIYSVPAKAVTARTTKKSEGIITDCLWTTDGLIVQESLVRTDPDHHWLYADPMFITYSSSLQEISRTTAGSLTFKRSSLQSENGLLIFTADGRRVPIE